ncbi:MAG: sporulation protein YabP [Acetivibrio sp.]
MEEKQKLASHKLIAEARKKALIAGVEDVIAFDAKEILLETEMGRLTIQGDNLHVNRLTLEKGEVDIEGRLDSFCYSAKKNGGEDSLLKRIFR